jgi:hypothetical protein
MRIPDARSRIARESGFLSPEIAEIKGKERESLIFPDIADLKGKERENSDFHEES